MRMPVSVFGILIKREEDTIPRRFLQNDTLLRRKTLKTATQKHKKQVGGLYIESITDKTA